MKIHSIILSLFFFVGALSCSDKPDQIQLRVKNNSTKSFEELFVRSGDGAHIFGTVDPRKYSEYITFENAYRYGFVEVIIDGEALVLHPIDYVGESHLKSGKYTYQLSLEEVDGGQYLTLTLVED